MANKAKYKIGQLVAFSGGNGVIGSVLTKKEGFSYGVDGQDDFVEEANITQAYRPVKAAAPRQPKAKKAGKRKPQQEQSAASAE